MLRFQKETRGISAPNSGRDTANFSDVAGSQCANCGHVGHEHDKERVYDDDGPTGSYHYEYTCPGGDA